jgi:predicted peptidase
MEITDQLQKDFNVDKRRLYLTGLSMGGFGTWDALQRWPDKFAAAVPVCGGGDVGQAKQIAKVPIWVFHGAKDSVVKPDRSRKMVNAIRAAGGDSKYTEYPEAGHDSWSETYRNPQLYDWLFAHKK